MNGKLVGAEVEDVLDHGVEQDLLLERLQVHDEALDHSGEKKLPNLAVQYPAAGYPANFLSDKRRLIIRCNPIARDEDPTFFSTDPDLAQLKKNSGSDSRSDLKSK